MDQASLSIYAELELYSLRGEAETGAGTLAAVHRALHNAEANQPQNSTQNDITNDLGGPTDVPSDASKGAVSSSMIINEKTPRSKPGKNAGANRRNKARRAAAAKEKAALALARTNLESAHLPQPSKVNAKQGKVATA